MVKVAVFGTGYVGLVSGVCIADFGMSVTCVDIDSKKIGMLNNGEIPIYEPGLDVFLDRNIRLERIKFTTDIKKAIETSEVIFIAVGTPPTVDGEADMQYVYSAAESIGKYINEYKVIVDKSTVPVGTGQEVKKIIGDNIKERGLDINFDVASNPEFLREGKALQDFTHPDRIVLGVESEKAAEILKKVYRPLYLNETPFIVTNIETAEIIKYASNAFLATKITFINEIANLCEKVGANVQQVAKGMGKDGRIGAKFLHAGPGYGGSCFPKDTKALVRIGKKYNVDMSLVQTTISANEKQKELVIIKLKEKLGYLKDKTIGILGLAFKSETDDMREAPSITIINRLIEEGANIKVYDPEAMGQAQGIFKDSKIKYCKHAYDVAEDCDVLILITEWHEFRNMDLLTIKKIMKTPVFFDTRNIYGKNDMIELGFSYIGTGA